MIKRDSREFHQVQAQPTRRVNFPLCTPRLQRFKCCRPKSVHEHQTEQTHALEKNWYALLGAQHTSPVGQPLQPPPTQPLQPPPSQPLQPPPTQPLQPPPIQPLQPPATSQAPLPANYAHCTSYCYASLAPSCLHPTQSSFSFKSIFKHSCVWACLFSLDHSALLCRDVWHCQPHRFL